MTVDDTHGAQNRNDAALNISVQAAPPMCFEDDDSHIAYAGGWHTVKNRNASGGHFRVLNAKGGTHEVRFDFHTDSTAMNLQYYFATSTKGGNADVFIDGEPVGTVSYQGDSGSMHKPEFGASGTFPVSGSGSHRFELRNVSGAAYLDRLCIGNGGSNAEPASNPGKTSTATSTLEPGEELVEEVSVPSDALRISVLSEADDPRVPYRLLVLDPAGSSIGTVESSINAVAGLDAPVTGPGTYVIRILNLGTSPVEIWRAATPHVQR